MPGDYGPPTGAISYPTALCTDPWTPRVPQTVPTPVWDTESDPGCQHFGFFLLLLSDVTSSPSPTEPLTNMCHGKKRPAQNCQMLRHPVLLPRGENLFWSPRKAKHCWVCGAITLFVTVTWKPPLTPQQTGFRIKDEENTCLLCSES